jgi:hypothetical protein
LNHRTVATMVEEALSVRSADRTQSLADDLRERLVAASARFSQIALELGKGLLYGVEVRRVGRQVQELASLALDQLPDPLSALCELKLSITTWPSSSVGHRTSRK